MAESDAVAAVVREVLEHAVLREDAPEGLVDVAPAGAWLQQTLAGLHRLDTESRELALAGRRLRYVGLIGSRAKVAKLVDRALEEGVSAEWLGTLHAPVGLDIGAVTPEEIAVSILAELVAVRRGKSDDPAVQALSMKWTAPTLERQRSGVAR